MQNIGSPLSLLAFFVDSCVIVSSIFTSIHSLLCSWSVMEITVLSRTVLFLAFVGSCLSSGCFVAADGSEDWGYVEVRPKAHLFWWLYRSPNRVDNGPTPWPTVLWLQGGPGASGVGVGNFQEIGPLDTDLTPRDSTWLQRADLLFVDCPVGTGYSYVEDESLLVKTDVEAANDMTTLLKELYNKNETLQKSPLFIIAESYGGKYAVTLGVAIIEAIKSRELKLKLGGVALGDSWISPVDFVLSWGPLLLDISRLDNNGLDQSNRLAEQIKQEVEEERYGDATDSWSDLEDLISSNSNNVDFYNFLLDSIPIWYLVSATVTESLHGVNVKRYSMYLSSKVSSDNDLDSLMNGIIREKLKIIPKNISWGGQSYDVFTALSNDFMKPRINEVDKLLSLGVNVTVYNGQLDVICATKGTEAWIQKLKWEGLKNFTRTERKALYCSDEEVTKGFFKSYRNLHFYWILKAGHFVPVDQPCLALKMLGEITQSPAATDSFRKGEYLL